MTTAASPLRRRPDQGGYARGEETRARIVTAALQAFGAEGYTRASTRQIAAEAGVNPPALQYYFHSKEGLHRACAEFIIARVNEAIGPVLERSGRIAEIDGPDRAREGLCDVLDVLVDVSLASAETGGWRQFMARAQADGAGPALPLLRDGMVRPLHRACARLVGLATGRPADDEQTRLRTILVLSQITTLHINAESTLSALDWPDFGGPRLGSIKRVIRAHTLRALGGVAGEPNASD